jgi:uncharacterized protein (TIGR03435 family)
MKPPQTPLAKSPNLSTRLALALAALLLASAPIPASCQTPPPAPTAFEVASVRMTQTRVIDDIRPGMPMGAYSTYPANRFFMHGVTLKNIIATAFTIDPDLQISSGLEWLDSQKYDIDAKVPGSDQLTYEQIKPLLQNLVQERFGLEFHRETKMVPGYALVVTKGGPKLQTAREGEDSSGYRVPNGLKMQNMSLSALATWLARPAGGPVVDQTGIKGNFDFRIDYATMNDANAALPDIFTALPEQLGLKLMPQKVPVEMFVIDHADRLPAEN